jgi:hypothetical protein
VALGAQFTTGLCKNRNILEVSVRDERTQLIVLAVKKFYSIGSNLLLSPTFELVITLDYSNKIFLK